MPRNLHLVSLLTKKFCVSQERKGKRKKQRKEKGKGREEKEEKKAGWW